MAGGGLVSDSIILDMIAEEIKHSNDGKMLLDGFPRTLEQAKALHDMIKIDMVIELNVPHQTIAERIGNRWVHAPSGRVYSYDFNPPKEHGIDDETSEPLTQREDDKPEVVLNRLAKYDEMTKPLTDYYSGQGVLHTFSGTMSKVIYENILNEIGEDLSSH